MSTATQEEFQVNQVLSEPENSLTYRVEEINVTEGKIRLVRSTKSGELHGLIKNTDGIWVLAADIEKWNVIGQYDPTATKAMTPKAPGTPRRRGPNKNKATGSLSVISGVNPVEIMAAIKLLQSALHNTAEALQKTIEESKPATSTESNFSLNGTSYAEEDLPSY